MTRPTVLRIGYAALGVAFLAIAGSALNGGLLLVALLLSLAGGLVLLFSDDDLPKWAGVTLVLFFVLLVVAFLAATPITIRKGGSYSLVPLAPDLATSIMDVMALVAPIMLAATTLAAGWERERVPRRLLAGSIVGFGIAAIVTVLTAPANKDSSAVAAARAQSSLAMGILAVSGLAACVAAFWCAARPEELG